MKYKIKLFKKDKNTLFNFLPKIYNYAESFSNELHVSCSDTY